MAEIDGQRIEDIAEHARQTERENAPARRETGARELRLDPWAEGPPVARPVIAIMKAEKPEAVMREEARATVKRPQFVNVDEHVENAIGKLVPPRPQPAVKDFAEIETGTRLALNHEAPTSTGWTSREPRGTKEMRLDGFSTAQGRATPPSSSATASPACKPSSWKPEPK